MIKRLLESARARLAVLLAPYQRWYASGDLFLLRLNRLEHVPIKDLAAAGPSRVEGTVVAVAAPLVSPIAQRKCVWYETAIAIEPPDSGSVPWPKRIYLQDGQDFVLRDDSGELLVRIRGAHVLPPKRLPLLTQLQRTPWQEPTAPVVGLMEQRGVPTELRVRVIERTLAAGDSAAVVGRLTPGSEGDPIAAFSGYRDHVLRPVLVDSREQPLIIQVWGAR